jgi:hypothetical protein
VCVVCVLFITLLSRCTRQISEGMNCTHAAAAAGYALSCFYRSTPLCPQRPVLLSKRLGRPSVDQLQPASGDRLEPCRGLPVGRPVRNAGVHRHVTKRGVERVRKTFRGHFFARTFGWGLICSTVLTLLDFLMEYLPSSWNTYANSQRNRVELG